MTLKIFHFKPPHMTLRETIISEVNTANQTKEAFESIQIKYRNYFSKDDFRKLLQGNCVYLDTKFKWVVKGAKPPHVTKKQLILDFVRANEHFNLSDVTHYVCAKKGEEISFKARKSTEWTLCLLIKSGIAERMGRGIYKSKIFNQ